MTALRLSPSGPVVENSSGGPFSPGPGARLRLREATSTCFATNVIPTVPAVIGDPIGAAGLELTIENAKQSLRYRATAVCDVQNPTTNVAQTVQLYWDFYINGAWVEVASNTHQVAAATTRQIRCDMPLTLGTELGMPATDSTLVARCRIGSAVGGTIALLKSDPTPGGSGVSKGTIDLLLEECF